MSETMPDVIYAGGFKHNMGNGIWFAETEFLNGKYKYISEAKHQEACVKSYNNALEDADKRHKQSITRLVERVEGMKYKKNQGIDDEMQNYNDGVEDVLDAIKEELL